MFTNITVDSILQGSASNTNYLSQILWLDFTVEKKDIYIYSKSQLQVNNNYVNELESFKFKYYYPDIWGYIDYLTTESFVCSHFIEDVNDSTIIVSTSTTGTVKIYNTANLSDYRTLENYQLNYTFYRDSQTVVPDPSDTVIHVITGSLQTFLNPAQLLNLNEDDIFFDKYEIKNSYSVDWGNYLNKSLYIRSNKLGLIYRTYDYPLGRYLQLLEMNNKPISLRRTTGF
ncbi:hypothetical protein EP331_07980 [bacterium]|nr:MAG: hypothetical protein EP331_07980 [bacterium]